MIMDVQLSTDKSFDVQVMETLASISGKDGLSAYELALKNGFVGTEQEWINSLTGSQGPQGEQGEKGDPFTYEDFTDEQKADLLKDAVLKSEIVDNLTSTNTDKALSANQGKVLNESKADKQNPYTGFEGGLAASAETGGAIGSDATTTHGGAVGSSAYTTEGGAVGEAAVTSDGFAGGKLAKAMDAEFYPIDAIQLGTGTNSTPKTFQVYDYQMMDADGNIPLDRLNNNIETTPTENSTKLITSGGVYSGIRSYIDEAILGGAW